MSRRTLDCFEACMLNMGESLHHWEAEYSEDDFDEECDDELNATGEENE